MIRATPEHDAAATRECEPERADDLGQGLLPHGCLLLARILPCRSALGLEARLAGSMGPISASIRGVARGQRLAIPTTRAPSPPPRDAPRSGLLRPGRGAR